MSVRPETDGLLDRDLRHVRDGGSAAPVLAVEDVVEGEDERGAVASREQVGGPARLPGVEEDPVGPGRDDRGDQRTGVREAGRHAHDPVVHRHDDRDAPLATEEPAHPAGESCGG